MIINEILKLYLNLIGGLLVVVALILIVLGKIFHKDVSSVWRIYRGWLIMIPFFLVFVFLGRVFFILGVLILSIFSFIEFSRATQLHLNRWIAYIVFLGIISVAILALIRNPPTGYFGAYGMFMALPVYAIGLIVLMPILQNHGRIFLAKTGTDLQQEFMKVKSIKFLKMLMVT